MDSILEFLKKHPPLLTAKSLTEEAISQQINLFKDNLIALQRAFRDLQLSLNQQAGSADPNSILCICTTSFSTTSNIPAECKRVLAAIEALFFQLMLLRGLEGKLLMAVSDEAGVVAPSPLQILQELHMKCAKIACAAAGDELNKKKFMKSLADTMHKHIQSISKMMHPLIK